MPGPLPRLYGELMLTLTLPEFQVLLRLPCWQFNEDIEIQPATQRQQRDDPHTIRGVLVRQGVFEPGFLNSETGKYEQFSVTYRQPFSFSRYSPGRLEVGEYDKADQRFSFGNVQVSKTAKSFCRAGTLEAELPYIFKDVDADGLLASQAFDELETVSEPEDFEANQILRVLVKSIGMSRPEIARRIGVGLHALHNYLAQPYHAKYRRCPLWVVDRVSKLANKNEKL